VPADPAATAPSLPQDWKPSSWPKLRKEQARIQIATLPLPSSSKSTTTNLSISLPQQLFQAFCSYINHRTYTVNVSTIVDPYPIVSRITYRCCARCFPRSSTTHPVASRAPSGQPDINTTRTDFFSCRATANSTRSTLIVEIIIYLLQNGSCCTQHRPKGE
jgi:hypothetical protein